MPATLTFFSVHIIDHRTKQFTVWVPTWIREYWVCKRCTILKNIPLQYVVVHNVFRSSWSRVNCTNCFTQRQRWVSIPGTFFLFNFILKISLSINPSLRLKMKLWVTAHKLRVILGLRVISRFIRFYSTFRVFLIHSSAVYLKWIARVLTHTTRP